MKWQESVDLSKIRFYPMVTRESTSLKWVMDNESRLKNRIRSMLSSKGLGYINCQDLYDEFKIDFMARKESIDFDPGFSDDPYYDEGMYIISRLKYFVLGKMNEIMKRQAREYSIVDDSKEDERTYSNTISINKIESALSTDNSFKHIELRGDLYYWFDTLIYFSDYYGFDLIEYFVMITKKENRYNIIRKLHTSEERLVKFEKDMRSKSDIGKEIKDIVSGLISLSKLEHVSIVELINTNYKLIENIRKDYTIEVSPTEVSFDSYMEILFKNATPSTVTSIDNKDQMVSSVIEAIGCNIADIVEELENVS